MKDKENLIIIIKGPRLASDKPHLIWQLSNLLYNFCDEEGDWAEKRHILAAGKIWLTEGERQWFVGQVAAARHTLLGRACDRLGLSWPDLEAGGIDEEALAELAKKRGQAKQVHYVRCHAVQEPSCPACGTNMGQPWLEPWDSVDTNTGVALETIWRCAQCGEFSGPSKVIWREKQYAD